MRDSGIGIDPALLPHVFEMFVQGARGPDRAEGGLGLGLSLVRTLTRAARRHGERAQRRTGPRQRVQVRLPAAALGGAVPARRTPPAPAWRRARASVRGQRVLVVDDNRDGAEMIAELLTLAGHEVQTANDPSEALALAAAFRPQVAILDIGLPVMDGYTLGRELRCAPGRRAARPDRAHRLRPGRRQARSQEAGFALHLVKPVDAEELVQLLDSLAAGAP